MSKNFRSLQVFKAISEIKNGALDEILTKVARSMDQPLPDESFKRAVRRDLNSLVEENILNISYQTPSGDPIPPDEEENHKNKRVRYHLLENKSSSLKGQAVLDRFGIEVVCKDLLAGCLNFSTNFSEVPSGSFFVAFDQGGAAFVFLWVNKADLPLSLHFSRKEKDAMTPDSYSIIRSHLSPRSLVLLVGHQSISRMKLDPIRAQFQLKIAADGVEQTLINQFEQTSINYSPIEDWSDTIRLFPAGDETTEFPRINFNWQVLENELVTENPLYIKLGDMLIISNSK